MGFKNLTKYVSACGKFNIHLHGYIHVYCFVLYNKPENKASFILCDRNTFVLNAFIDHLSSFCEEQILFSAGDCLFTSGTNVLTISRNAVK